MSKSERYPALATHSIVCFARSDGRDYAALRGGDYACPCYEVAATDRRLGRGAGPVGITRTSRRVPHMAQR